MATKKSKKCGCKKMACGGKLSKGGSTKKFACGGKK